jgi:hypothetical protein
MAFNHSDTDRIAVYPNRPQKTMVRPKPLWGAPFFRIRFAVVRGGECGGYFTYFLPPLMTMPFESALTCCP